MSITDPEVVTIQPTTTATVRGVVAMSELPAFFDRSFSTLAEVISAQGVTITGPAFGLYHSHPSDTIDVEVGFPIDRAIEPSGDAVAGTLPGGRVARVVHAGSFDGLGDAWERLVAWTVGQGIQTVETPFWEVYLTEPSPDMDPADLRTELNLPLEG